VGLARIQPGLSPAIRRGEATQTVELALRTLI
jgi:hypothetical protein